MFCINNLMINGKMCCCPQLIFVGARNRQVSKIHLVDPFQPKGLPSVNQTWLDGEWTIEISDFPFKTSIDSGFSIAMFHYQRVKGWLKVLNAPCKFHT